MTTVHAYTSDQQLQDMAHATRKGTPDLRRMRAAALSIIPSTTGAARAIGLVLPELKGRLDGTSLRVPTPTGSITDLTAELATAASVEDDQRRVRARPRNDPSYRGVLEYSDEPLVSADIVGNPASCIYSALDTMANGNLVEGARLVRQRVGLLEPPRRPRRVRRRAERAGDRSPMPRPDRVRRASKTCRCGRGPASWCASTSTSRCATASSRTTSASRRRCRRIEWLLERDATRRRVRRTSADRRARPIRSYSMAPGRGAARRAARRTEVPLAPRSSDPTSTCSSTASAPGQVMLLENLRFEPGETAERPGVRGGPRRCRATST